MSANTVIVEDIDAGIRYSQTLVTETCYLCGVVFAWPESLRKECLKDHSRSFYCPNGHGQVFAGKTEAQRLREQLDAARHRAEMAETASRRSRETAMMHKRQAAAYKGQLTRARKRLGAGVCPVPECHRTVSQLADHMAAKHPTYASDPVTP